MNPTGELSDQTKRADDTNSKGRVVGIVVLVVIIVLACAGLLTMTLCWSFRGSLLCRKADVSNATATVDEWSQWGGCGAMCGGGNATRYRRVQWSSQSIMEAEVRVCALTGSDPAAAAAATVADAVFNWHTWSLWSACSENCGPSGKQTRARLCLRVTGAKKELAQPNECREGLDFQSQSCNTDTPCPEKAAVLLEWHAWFPWGECTKTCGPDGKQTRIRLCLKVTGARKELALPAECPGGLDSDSQSCNTKCEVFEWSEWANWSACTKPCMPGGVKKRLRSCNQLTATGSKGIGDFTKCPGGNFQEYDICNYMKPCPNKWSIWKTHSSGIQYRDCVDTSTEAVVDVKLCE